MRISITVLFFSSITFYVQSQTPGKITDTVRCADDKAQIYSLYLPSNYSVQNKFALMLFFEPGARARLPIQLYNKLADRYSLIIACSYGSSNEDRPRSLDAGYAMLHDIAKRFKVDSSAIFLAGFSGGARLSSFIAIGDRQFAGVIACGATFAETKITKARKVPYAMLMGERDMNYLELKQSETYLAEIRNPFLALEFRGEHEWPDTTTFEQAIVWHLMTNEQLDKSENGKIYQFKLEQVKQQLDSGNWITCYYNTTTLAAYANSVSEKKESDSLIKIITGNNDYVKAKKEQEKIFKLEREWRTKFYDQYMPGINSFRPDTAFHEKDWGRFRQEFSRLRASKDKYKKLSGERLHDFAWRLCAEKAWIFYRTKDYPRALLSTQIWTAYYPDHPYSWLMLARVNVAQGNKKDATENLKKALEKGLEKSTIEHDAVFDSIRTEIHYKKIMSER